MVYEWQRDEQELEHQQLWATREFVDKWMDTPQATTLYWSLVRYYNPSKLTLTRQAIKTFWREIRKIWEF